jgi:pathogenesis-related protein 1
MNKFLLIIVIAIGVVILSAATGDSASRRPDSDRRGPETNSRPLSQVQAKEMLDAHNSWRSQYGVPPLAWSPKLAGYAQQWANTLLQRKRLEHRSNSSYGENLAMAMGQRFTPEQVVDMWGSESRDYDQASNSCSRGKVCGHFTQVVWRDTMQVGCGVARDEQREVWVCNYYPPGNVIGYRPY